MFYTAICPLTGAIFYPQESSFWTVLKDLKEEYPVPRAC